MDEPAILLIAAHLIKNGSFPEVQSQLALNQHWYDIVKAPSLQTHLKPGFLLNTTQISLKISFECINLINYKL